MTELMVVEAKNKQIKHLTSLATNNNSDFTITESGDAYVSQRKLAEMIDVPRPSIQSLISRHLHPVQSDMSQGLNPEMVTKCVQYFSTKGKPKAIEFLGTLAEAGAKAWMYHEAGFTMEAKPTQTKPKQITHSSTNTSQLLTDIFGGSEEFLPSVTKSNEDYSSFSSESLSLLVTSEGDLMTNKNLMSKETGVSRKDINRAVSDVEKSYKQNGIYETNVIATDKNGKVYTLNAYLLVCERLRQLKCLVGNLASESFLLQADSYYLSDQFKEQLKYSMQLRNINQEMIMVSNQKALGVSSGTIQKDLTDADINDLTSLRNNKTLKQLKNDFALNEDTPDSVKEELDAYDKLNGRTKEIILHDDDLNIMSSLSGIPTKNIETRTVFGGKRTVKVYDKKIGKNEDGINQDAYFIHSIVPAENESYQETTNRRQELKLYKKIGYFHNDNSKYDSIKLDTAFIDRIISKQK